MGMQGGGLPGEYRKIEYLESSGTQYINTEAYFLANDKCIIDFAPLESSVDKAVFGIYENANQCAELGLLRNRFRFDVQAVGDLYEVGRRYKAIKNGSKWGIDDWTSSLDFPNENCTTHGLLLCGRWYNGTATKLSANRIYRYVQQRDGTNVCDLIPCVRKSDNKPGMYDTVTKTFFTNAGTGEFIIP